MISLYFVKTQTALTRLIHVVFLFTLMLLSAKADAQCPPGAVDLNTQAQVDQFIIDYPNCTEIAGYLFIGSTGAISNITDLSPLNNLITVRELWIRRTSLTSINGLDNLTNVTQQVQIYQNFLLTSFDGLNSLQNIGGFLNFDLPELTSCSGFNNLTSIGSYMYFNNTKVPNVTGFNNLSSIGGFLVIDGNTELTNVDFMNKVTIIPSNFAIRNNAKLQNVNGFGNLTAVNGVVQIINNTVLNDITGFQNIDPTTISENGLIIENNPALAVCNLPNFCGYLFNDPSTHPRNISGNLGNCLDEATVMTHCPICPPGNIEINTQAELNLFPLYYPLCTVVDEDLFIGVSSGTSDITDLSPLNNIETVRGNFNIERNAIATINGLNNLKRVEGYVYIGLNPSLTQINNLNGLTFIGNSLNIRDNASLTTISGLNNLTNTGGYFQIRNNETLTSISGLSKLNNVGGYFNIYDNVQLTSLNGLENLTSIGSDIDIRGNTVLTDISALQNTTFNPSGNFGLTILNNPSLAVCNLPNFCIYLANDASTHPRDISGNLGNCLDEAAVVTACTPSPCPPGDIRLRTQSDVNQFVANYPNCTEIEGLLRIGADDGSSSDITNISGLNNLNKIGTILFIQNNGVLQNLDGLQGLTQLGGRLFIGVNAQLQNIDGLNNISSIGGEIGVLDNAALNNIQGLRNIDPAKIAGLFITNNAALAVCDLPNFCTYLANDAGTHPRNISGNLGNCLDEAAVVTACTPSPCPPAGQLSLTTQAEVNQFLASYPNCTEIEGNLFIGRNIDAATSDITDLTPLSNVTSVGGWIAIYNNSLTNLNGLHNLTNILHDIDIRANANLTDIAALQNANFSPFDGFGLTISNNPALAVCHLNNFCTYLANPAATHPRSISDNAGDCISAEAVTNACLVSIDEFDTASFAAWPNPVSGILNITYSKVISSVEVTDIMGRTVIRETAHSNDIRINMSSLSAGIYLVQVNIEDQVKVVKVMKQ